MSPGHWGEDEDEVTRIVCPKCDGTGGVDSHRCDLCAGAGLVDAETRRRWLEERRARAR